MLVGCGYTIGMQFQVPQFIEVEDKIFGPLTFKQFIYLAGAAGLAFIAWRSLPIYLAALAIAGFGGLGAALALFEWNGRPFILALESGFYYLVGPKLYLWSHQRKQQRAHAAAQTNQKISEVYVPRLSESKLHDLAWSLDIKEKIEKIGMRDLSRSVTLKGVPTEDSLAAVRTAQEALVR